MMPAAPKKPVLPRNYLRTSGMRGMAQLATQATQGVARIAEGVHQSVWAALGAPTGQAAGQTRGITGLVYKSILGVTHLLGTGVDKVLARLQPLLESAEAAPPESPQREAVLAALNGVLGYTPVYVRYNTGLHTSQNGRELSQQLEQLVQHWPVPLDELTVIAYNMNHMEILHSPVVTQKLLSWLSSPDQASLDTNA